MHHVIILTTVYSSNLDMTKRVGAELKILQSISHLDYEILYASLCSWIPIIVFKMWHNNSPCVTDTGNFEMFALLRVLFRLFLFATAINLELLIRVELIKTI